jgi:apolipoprotein D and lipocalin family protein
MQAYAGRWYEIAKYPFVMECRCTSAMADYKFIGENLHINNSCLIGAKIVHSSKAIGIPNGKNTFDVYFSSDAPAGKYIILWTDYVSWSFVGGGNQYWILSRKPKINNEDLVFILNKTKELGYDVNMLQLNLFNYQ